MAWAGFRIVKAKPKAHPLVKLLIMKMNEQGIGVEEMCKEAGIARQTFGWWGREQNPKVDNLEACFNVVGYRLVVEPLPGTYEKASPFAGEYLVTSPVGIEHRVLDLKKFCKEQGLSYGSMKNILQGTQNQHKGWTVTRT